MKPIKYLVVIAFTAILLMPLYLMLIGSFQEINGLMKWPPNLIPVQTTLKNYEALFTDNEYSIHKGIDKAVMPKWAVNTIVILIVKVFLVISIALMAGYAFSVYTFKFKKPLFIFFIFGIVMPPVFLIPSYITVNFLGLVDSKWGVILPAAFSAMAVYLFKNFIDTIPRSFIDSARIDGAGEASILTKIILPLCKPPIGVITILVSLGTLSDYIWSLLILRSYENQTFTVGIITLIEFGLETDWVVNPIGMSFAGGIILVLPMLLIFSFSQKYFMTGAITGGIKG